MFGRSRVLGDNIKDSDIILRYYYDTANQIKKSEAHTVGFFLHHQLFSVVDKELVFPQVILM